MARGSCREARVLNTMAIGYHDGVYMMFLLTYFPWGPVKEQPVGSFPTSLKCSKLCNTDIL